MKRALFVLGAFLIAGVPSVEASLNWSGGSTAIKRRCKDERGRFVKCSPPVPASTPEPPAPVDPPAPDDPALTAPRTEGAVAVTVETTTTTTEVEIVKRPAAKMSMAVFAGVQVSLGTDQEEKATPFVLLKVAAPTADSDWAPRLLVEASFTALPGQTLSLAQAETINALEFKAGLAQLIHPTLKFRIFGVIGYATTLPGEGQPSSRAPKWGSVGIVFGDLESRAWLSVGAGGDQRLSLDGHWRATLHVDGAIDLWEADEGALRGVKLTIIASSILGLEGRVGFGGRSDCHRLSVSVGR